MTTQSPCTTRTSHTFVCSTTPDCDLCCASPSSEQSWFALSPAPLETLKCTQCTLHCHSKCFSAMTPLHHVYALTKARERKYQDTWRTHSLPNLKSKSIVLEKRSKELTEKVKQFKSKIDREQWQRSWALRTFATGFYSRNVPKKNDETRMNTLVGYYSKTPARTKSFFDKLLETYPQHRGEITHELNGLTGVLEADALGLLELDRLEASLEANAQLTEELRREIVAPMLVPNGVAPPWRVRLSVDKTFQIAMGDFFFERMEARIRVSAGMATDATAAAPFVHLEVLGLTSPKATFGISVNKLFLTGPTFPVSYTAERLEISFEYYVKVHVVEENNGKWSVVQEEYVVTGLKHKLEGASIPIPSSVLSFALEKILTFGLKKALLSVLPLELGPYISRLAGPACNFEWALKIESKVSRFDMESKSCFSDFNLKKAGFDSWLSPELCRLVLRSAIWPDDKEKTWTLNTLLKFYRRFVKDSLERDFIVQSWSEEFLKIMQARGETSLLPKGVDPGVAFFIALDRLDRKPVRIEFDCVRFEAAVRVRDLARIVKAVSLRALSSKSVTSLNVSGGDGISGMMASALPSSSSSNSLNGMAGDASSPSRTLTTPSLIRHSSLHRRANSSGAMPSTSPASPNAVQLLPKSQAVNEARAALSELFTSFEAAVESTLSHAVRELKLGIEFALSRGSIHALVSKIRIFSRLGEQFEAQIPAQWIANRFLQTMIEGWPWKNSFRVEPATGALAFDFHRFPKASSKDFENVNPQSDFTLSVADVEARIEFRGLIDDLVRRQREALFGSVAARVEAEAADASSLGSNEDSLFANALMREKGGAGTATSREEAFVMMRLGSKGSVGAVAKGLGNPVIETTVDHVLLKGFLPSFIRFCREYRSSKFMIDLDSEDAASYVSGPEYDIPDQVDRLLEKLEYRIHSEGPEQRLFSSFLLTLDAKVTDDFDLYVSLGTPPHDPRPAFVFVDDIELATLVSDLIQFIFA